MASRSVSRLAQWYSRIFMVEINQKTEPLYFAFSSKPSALSPELEALFGSGKVFSVCAQREGRVQNARSHAQLKSALAEQLSPGCDLLDAACFLPDVRNSLVKGFFLRGNAALCSAERTVSRLRQNGSATSVLEYTRESGGGCACSEAGDEPHYYVTPAPAPACHPATLNIINSDVFYRLEDAVKVLQECNDVIPEAKAVLELVEEQKLEFVSNNVEKFPVIVIEGLDATGKTTLTCSLQKALSAVLLKSPPQCLVHFRQRFDAEPPLIRRAFYALGNYITAAQIARDSAHAPVIVDRYWHSTAAYAIATAVSGREENLPAVGSEIYEWPSDLLRPGLVLLLSVSPEERLRRLAHRGLDKTEEESQLEINHLFRRKVDEAYKRIQNPACIVVDASPSPDHVLQQVLSLIRNKYNL